MRPTDLAVQDGTLSWRDIPNAGGYIVGIDDKTTVTDKNSYDIQHLPSGAYSLKVKAIVDKGD
jgi:hypothetical protein